MMSGSAGLHTDQAWRYLAEELNDLLAPQLTGDDDFACTIYAVHLEHVLGKINADGANLHVDDPSRDSLFNNHPLAHSILEAGVVHPIIRVGLTGSRRLPVYPRERTFSG
jgi:hypothetical protein